MGAAQAASSVRPAPDNVSGPRAHAASLSFAKAFVFRASVAP